MASNLNVALTEAGWKKAKLAKAEDLGKKLKSFWDAWDPYAAAGDKATAAQIQKAQVALMEVIGAALLMKQMLDKAKTEKDSAPYKFVALMHTEGNKLATSLTAEYVEASARENPPAARSAEELARTKKLQDAAQVEMRQGREVRAQEQKAEEEALKKQRDEQAVKEKEEQAKVAAKKEQAKQAIAALSSVPNAAPQAGLWREYVKIGKTAGLNMDQLFPKSEMFTNGIGELQELLVEIRRHDLTKILSLGVGDPARAEQFNQFTLEQKRGANLCRVITPLLETYRTRIYKLKEERDQSPLWNKFLSEMLAFSSIYWHKANLSENKILTLDLENALPEEVNVDADSESAQADYFIDNRQPKFAHS